MLNAKNGLSFRVGLGTLPPNALPLKLISNNNIIPMNLTSGAYPRTVQGKARKDRGHGNIEPVPFLPTVVTRVSSDLIQR